MIKPDPAAWRSLCDASSVAKGEPRRIEIADMPALAVFHLDEGFFVTDDTCTHGAASLAEGFIEGDEVECPWHSGKFCIKTGEATAFPAVEPIKVYRTRVIDGKVCIDTEVSDEARAGPASHPHG